MIEFDDDDDDVELTTIYSLESEMCVRSSSVRSASNGLNLQPGRGEGFLNSLLPFLVVPLLASGLKEHFTLVTTMLEDKFSAPPTHSFSAEEKIGS